MTLLLSPETVDTSTSSMFSFQLSPDFIEDYAHRKVHWGYTDAGGNALGEITFLRTYSRIKPDGSKEQWYEVCERVVNGMYSIQKDWVVENRLPWDEAKAQLSAQEAYDRLFDFKWTPPGRGLWTMGTPLVNKYKNSAPLQNCCHISTRDMTEEDPTGPFCLIMEGSMLGIGMGLDTKGGTKGFRIYTPKGYARYTIPDTRQGWVASLKLLLESYWKPNHPEMIFDYSVIRPAGEPIKTFGGTASGPEPLRKLHEALRSLFDGRQGDTISTVDVTDVANLIGVCVVAGNVRRSAELVMGSLDDDDFLNLKNPTRFPVRNSYDPEAPGWSWLSNNSVEATVESDLSPIVEGNVRNGEPGVVWTDVLRNSGRLIDPPDGKDYRVSGTNPCQPSWAPVLTPEGIRTIGDISEGDTIWAETGWAQVSAKWSTGVKPVYAYRTSAGVFYGTENHRLVSAGEKVEAKDCAVIDSLSIPEGDYAHTDSPSITAFLQEFGDVLSYPAETVRITEVEYLGDEEVFDITVDNEPHTYWTGGLNVSNCAEMALESAEMCTLSEVFLNRHDSMEDFHRTLKFAYLYAKTVTLMPTAWEKTNSIMLRNRRIGLSISGQANFADRHGLATLREWQDKGYGVVNHYDEIYSEWLCIRPSIRMTTVKPAGTVALLAGESPGVHWSPGGQYFERRIRFSKDDPMVDLFREANYLVEPAAEDPTGTVVVAFPIKSLARRSEKEVSIYEKANLAVSAQRYWSDNSVSVTLSFNPETEAKDVARVLEMHAGQFKTVSFLPMANGSYPQMPYTDMTEELYRTANILPVDFTPIYRGTVDVVDAEGERGCSTDKCELPVAS